MKILRNTPDLLVIEDRLILLVAALGLFMVLFVGVAFDAANAGDWVLATLMVLLTFGMWVVIRQAATRTRLTFDRPSNMLTIRQKSVKGTRDWTYQIGDLGPARVGVMTGETDTFRLELTFAKGMDKGFTHPVTDTHTSGQGSERAKNAINEWLGIG